MTSDSELLQRPLRMRHKPEYDRHRHIRKRLTLGGNYLMGAWLPEIHRTWGEVFAARLWGQKMSARLRQYASPEI